MTFPEPAFAHPVEREYARVLDRHGVPWRYEPWTFVLERNPDGSVHEAFTPDFYLPDQDVFVETTVMQQRLTGRKNRKVRKLRDRYGIDVLVLYRRDLLRLARRWRLHGLERAVHAPAPTGSDDELDEADVRDGARLEVGGGEAGL